MVNHIGIANGRSGYNRVLPQPQKNMTVIQIRSLIFDNHNSETKEIYCLYLMANISIALPLSDYPNQMITDSPLLNAKYGGFIIILSL